MADNSDDGGTVFLAFLAGGLIVAVVVLGLFVFNGHAGNGSSSTFPTHLTFNVKPSKDGPEPH
jgi:hypothetical protein